ncbi:DDB1- and CUL4-associated factor 5 [Amblyomma americanum]
MVLQRQARGSILDFAARRQYDADLRSRNALIRDRFAAANCLYRKDLYAHYGCVNAIEFSDDGEWLVSGGDDKRVLLWNVQEAISGPGRPRVMKGHHNSNIFCLCFDSCHSAVFSAGNDEQVVVHDVATGATKDVFLHEEAVYGLSVQPGNDNVFASACDDGCILVYDIREPRASDPLLLATSRSAFHAVAYNPTEPRLLVTANSHEGAALWDVRQPMRWLLRYSGGSGSAAQSAMSVRFNRRGSHVLALRRRRPPAVFRVESSRPLVQVDHAGYHNSCTMKSCCFAGQRDEYVMSGSDDFNLYAWKLPDDVDERPVDANCAWVAQAHLVLQGHRSIVNQVRFNPSSMVVASSGVEKMIKLWSSLPLPGGLRSLSEAQIEPRRRRYSYQEYVELVLESGQLMSHDYSHKSMEEDPRMMAFFDSLVQRDAEGWSSSDTSHVGSGWDTSSESSTEEERRSEQLARIRRLKRQLESSDSDDNWVPSSPILPPSSEAAEEEEPQANEPATSDPTSTGQRARADFKRPRCGFHNRRSYRRRRRSGSADNQ